MGCFIDPDLALDGSGAGPLAGFSFAVKDIYDIAGHVSHCGNPDWGRTHPPSAATAPVVEALLAAGANLRGKAHTDEIAYSINGENHHYGTPINPNAPGRIPGGSSSGSASAVAGGLVDFALGSDTGGSVRVPASFCGIFGLRPTHDRIPLEGIMPLAVSFDTIGWFARDPKLLEAVGKILIPNYRRDPPAPSRLLVPEDAWALASEETQASLRPFLEALEARFGEAERMILAPNGIDEWFKPLRVAQGYEIWQQHKAWVEAEKPGFGPGIAERVRWTSTLSDADKSEAEALRALVVARIAEVTAGGGVLVMPIAPGAAPLAGRKPEELEQFRYQVLQLSGIAPLAKVPQISLPLAREGGLPLAREGGLPVALSLMAGAGGDEMLLRLAAALCGPADGGSCVLL